MDNLNQNPGESNIPENQGAGHAQKSLIALIIILSLIFGGVGGAAGSLYILKQPWGQKLLAVSGQNLNQKITVNEDSAIIDAVKKTKQAVVSIIISKDLSKLPGFSGDPFSQDPFFNFFYNGQRVQPQNQNPSSPNVQEVGAGSGFLVSADGLILTNKHVVADSAASYTVLTADGKKYDAKVLAQDPVNDLAIVKIDIKNAPFLTLANSSNIQIGQRVIAIGNALGQYQNTVTSGIISGIGRSITAGSDTGGSEDLSGVIQTDAAINPGNSGGPLLDIAGNVIGINTAIDQQGQLVGFAIPSNDIAKALASYNKNGKITRPFLGVRYLPVNQALADSQHLPVNYGALIVRGATQADLAVQPGSPADKAGLMENDIILAVNSQNVDDTHQLSDLLKNYNPGDKVALRVYHKGKVINIEVILAESK